MGGSYALKRRAVCSMWSEYTVIAKNNYYLSTKIKSPLSV